MDIALCDTKDLVFELLRCRRFMLGSIRLLLFHCAEDPVVKYP